MMVFDPQAGKVVRGTLMAGKLERREARNKNRFLSGTVYDRGGFYKVAIFHQETVDLGPEPGDVIEADWKCKEWNGDWQLDVAELLAVTDHKEVKDTSPYVRVASVRRPEWMDYYKRNVEPLIEDAPIRTLLDFILHPDSGFWRAAAAKSMHQNWRGGLSEHVHRILQLFVGMTYGGHPSVQRCRRGLVIAGIILHDWGKEIEYQEVSPGSFEVGRWGNLMGHLAGGPIQIARIMERQGIYMSEELSMHFFHVLLAHHGEVAWGSPVTPKTAEAAIVHYLDNLDGKLSAIEEAGDEVKCRMVDGLAIVFRVPKAESGWVGGDPSLLPPQDAAKLAGSE